MTIRIRAVLLCLVGITTAAAGLPHAISPQGGAPQAVRTTADAPPQPLPAQTAPPNSPNVIYIVIDDLGFGELGSFGAEIRTPSIDAVASQGLRFTNFHTRSICSPTRASLLTGRNSHAVGMKDLAGSDTGYANARGRITPAAATIAQTLHTSGYSTYALGKWHLTPHAEMVASGDRTHWPLQKGFDRFYGFLSGWTDQFHPALTIDNHPAVTPDRDGYHFSEDIVDQSIRVIRDGRRANGSKPFFLYLAFGAAHSPVQVPDAYLQKYRGRYDKGWDHLRAERFGRQKAMGLMPATAVMAPRRAEDRAWDSLSPDERRVFARYMEIYAAFVEHPDAQIGRFVAYLRDTGELENTLLVILSDNGPASEAQNGGFTSPYGGSLPTTESLARLDDLGTERSEPMYQREWAMAGAAPFQMYKLSMFEGGLRTPLIISWPRRIAGRDGIRAQFIDVNAVTPTVYDLLGITPSAVFAGVPQMPMHGASFRAILSDASAPPPRDRQVYELRGNRAIWHAGWKAVTVRAPSGNFDDDRWLLFDLSNDPAEAVDVADKHPDRLRAMQALWWEEAARQGVLPLTQGRGRGAGAGGNDANRSLWSRIGSFRPISSRISQVR
jgi:arylsulfatase A-like enzyme